MSLGGGKWGVLKLLEILTELSRNKMPPSQIELEAFLLTMLFSALVERVGDGLSPQRILATA